MSVIPNINSRLDEAATKELLESGYTEESIVNAPHYLATPEQLSELLNHPVTKPGLTFVYSNLDGSPRLQKNGKPYVRAKIRRTVEEVTDYENRTGKKSGKYTAPSEGGCHLYYSPFCQEDMTKVAADANKAVYITEGEKKTDVMNIHGFRTIGLSGVYSWRSTPAGETESRPIDDFEDINWKKRHVYLVPDSDVIDSDKPMIRHAMKNLAIYLKEIKGAIVHLVVLPSEINGSRNGADDFIKKYGRTKFGTFARFSKPALKNGGKSTKNPLWELDLTPPDAERQAQIISWLLASDYAVRPGNGLYKFQETHWRHVHSEEVIKLLHDAYDSQEWRLNTTGSLSFAEKVVCSNLTIGEANWNRGFGILFANGTYNPSLKLFTPVFDRGNYGTTQPLSFEYSLVPRTCDRFLQFLNEATGGDTKTIELLQAIVRYVWSPKDKSKPFPIQCVFDFYGGKNTGKSTFIELLVKGLGDDSYGSAEPDVFTTPEKLAGLLDKTAAVSFDCHGHLKSVGVFNSVVSNEPVQVRTLYKQPMLTRLGLVVIRAYNAFISVASGGTQGLDRRILAIEFNRPPKVVDTTLGDKLASELPGIFQWAFSITEETMIKRIQTRNNSELALSASVDRFIDNNPVYSFLLQRYEFEGTKDICIKVLYPMYKEWCDSQGMGIMQQKRFFKSATDLGCKVVTHEGGKPKLTSNYRHLSIPAMKDYDIKAHLAFGDSTEEGEEISLPLEEIPVIEVTPANEEKPVKDSAEFITLAKDVRTIGFKLERLDNKRFRMSRSTGYKQKVIEVYFESMKEARTEVDRRLELESPAGMARIRAEIVKELEQELAEGDLTAGCELNDIKRLGADRVIEFCDYRVLLRQGKIE